MMMFFKLSTLLVCLWAVSPALSIEELSSPWTSSDQHPLLLTTSTPLRNYSIGFSLASSYGAAAVIIDDPNDEKKTLTWVVYGDQKYQEVMARLSLESSRHLAPPYNDMGEYFDDIPRVLARRALKKVGLPASSDVGALASVIKELRAQIETNLKITISDATLTTTHLEALYEDDVQDICENAGFKYIIPKSMFKPILWETSCAYAGYGLGLCKHWQNDTQCTIEEDEFTSKAVLAVHYSKTALTVTHASIRTAIGTLEPWGFRLENFTLGSDASTRYANEDDYWRDVNEALLHVMLQFPTLEKPDMIILTGDKADGKFIHKVEDAMKDHMWKVPPIFSEDALVIAAKGAAEFRRRGQADWQ